MGNPNKINGTLDAVRWGQSTGGSPGQVEDETTIGLPRLDTKLVPNQEHISGEQLAHYNTLLTSISRTFRGGTRSSFLFQNSAPFDVNEQGIWGDGYGNVYYYFQGTNTALTGGGGGGGLPSQAGHANSYLFTNGTTASWQGISCIVWTQSDAWTTVLGKIASAGGAALVLLDPGSATGQVSFTMGPESADLSRVAFQGLPNANGTPIIEVDPAFRLLGNPTLNLDNVSINVSAPLYVGTAPLSLSLRRSGIQRETGSVGPTFDLSAAGAASFADVESYDWGYFLNEGDSSPIILLGSGGTGELLIMGDNNLYAFAGGLFNAPSSGSHASISFAADSSVDYHVGAFGAYCDVTTTWFSQAGQVAYTPTTPADWTTPPTTVAQALDELGAIDRHGASVSELQLTTTIATTVVTYTPAAQGAYSIGVYFRVITNPTVVTITATWTDASGAQTYTMVGTDTIPIGSRVLPSFIINATTSPITISATANMTNQVYVTASIIEV